MNASTWHVDDVELEAYARESTAIGTTYSIESHLEQCARCRARLASAASDPDTIETGWLDIVDRIDRPRATIVERSLRAVGVPSTYSRLLAATRGLSVAWIVAQIGTVAFAVLASRYGRSDADIVPFLVLAPVLPLVSVLLSYLPRLDPASEIGVATPMAGRHLLLVRSAAVFAATSVLLGVSSAFVERGWIAAAWVIPALALTTVTLAVGSFVGTERVGVIVLVGWLIGLATLSFVGPVGRTDGARIVAAFGSSGQYVMLAIAVGASGLMWLRRARFEPALELQREGW